MLWHLDYLNITTFFKTQFIEGTPFIRAHFFWDTQCTFRPVVYHKRCIPAQNIGDLKFRSIEKYTIFVNRIKYGNCTTSKVYSVISCKAIFPQRTTGATKCLHIYNTTHPNTSIFFYCFHTLGGYHFLWNRGVINIRKYPSNIFANPSIGQK